MSAMPIVNPAVENRCARTADVPAPTLRPPFVQSAAAV